MNKVLKCALSVLLFFTMTILPVSAYVEIVEQDESYFVTDEAKVLDGATEEYIVSKNQLLNETSGAAIVVVTVELLNADIVDYAYSIFNEWQLGDETVNNGILLLISTIDQDYYCMIGRGLETVFPVDELQDILDEKLEPDFATGNYQAGIRKVFDELYQKCVQLYNVNENSSTEPVDRVLSSVASVFQFFEIMMMIFLIITIVVVIFSITSRRRVVYTRPVRPVPPPPPVFRGPRMTHRPTHHHTSPRPYSRPSSFSSNRSSGFSSSSRPSSTRSSFRSSSSSSFRPRTGGSSRGAGAGRRR